LPTLKPASASESTRSEVESPTVPITPWSTIEVRHVDAAGGVLITMAGVIGRNDAAILSKQLHTALDAAPTVLVVNLSQVVSCDQAGPEVLATARERADAAGIALHVIGPTDLLAGDQLAVADQARRTTSERRADR
jgi:ABC-type transporter Mla MlaB component